MDYFLPGVFDDSPAPEVNNSLWTIPFECFCYLMLAGFTILGLLRWPFLVLAAAILYVASGFLFQFYGHAAPTHHLPSAGEQQLILQKIFGTTLFLGRGARLVVAFLLGASAFLFRDRLPYDRRLFAACLGLCLSAALLGPARWMTQPVLNAIVCPAIVYITIFLGLSKPPHLPFLSRGDYSYGVYLYGFPIQQSARALFPTLDPFSLLGVALAAIMALAALSWHLVEKPALRLRRQFALAAKEQTAQAALPEISTKPT